MGNYIVDFLSYSARLIIEVDGFQHYEDSALIYDAKRTRYLNSQGFTVLRFDNGDVKYRLNNVLEEIYFYLDGEYCPEQLF
ncbi:endonuclease domain-containing protein [Lonepinella sp. MS14436]|uniref:endonuclease domain-containing protein n=1 Tax=Lonepinella sp. MS14436 TaxID=3003619 RepID=UPI0036D9C774